MTDETKRVAREPTREMIRAAMKVGPFAMPPDWWRAMYDAAPAAAPSDRERRADYTATEAAISAIVERARKRHQITDVRTLRLLVDVLHEYAAYATVEYGVIAAPLPPSQTAPSDRERRLHEALREEWVYDTGDTTDCCAVYACHGCGERGVGSKFHAPDCLAAPLPQEGE